jgi:glutamate-1-semialdehyde 2,1-aminomutase
MSRNNGLKSAAAELRSVRAPVSAALFERATRVLPGGNTRTTVFFPPHPYYAASGSGSRVTDVDGIERLDAVNNYTSLIHGHCRPEVTAAVMRQLQFGTCFGMPTESEIELAELLCARLPAVEQIRFTNSGTEAVMMAIKAARAFTNRPVIAKCEGAYHGTYDYAEISEIAAPDNWGDQIRPASVAASRGTPSGVLNDVVVLPFNDTAASERILREHRQRLAAILIDPMPNRAGLIPASAPYLSMLRRVADETGSLLIFDEVISYRVGFEGAQGRFEARPDLTTLGKIIGGGFPVGAVGGRAQIMEVFDPRNGRPAVPHGGTFTANPVTMSAGLASMKLMTRDQYERLEVLGQRLEAGLLRVLAAHGVSGGVSGMGSLRRVHLSAAGLSGYRGAVSDPQYAQLMARLHRAMLENGVFIVPNGMIVLSTAMTAGDVDQIIDAFSRSIEVIEMHAESAG